MLRAYHARVKQELARFDAMVEKFIGDAVVALFGAPQAHSDDAERAVRAGVRALAAVRELTLPGDGRSLSARAAVATGEAVVTVDANPGTGEALAMGDVVNTASRLQSAAPEHGLVVDDETRRATRRSVRYRALEPVVAKGKSDPITAWLVEEVLATAAGSRGPAALVGRQHELAQLLSASERVVEQRRPCLVTIIGVAGAGKSRLAREFIAHVDARVVVGRCVPYDHAGVYGVFAQQLKQLAGVAETDQPDEALAKASALVDRVVPPPERPEVLRCIAVLLGAATEQPLVGEQMVLLYSFRRLLEAVAVEQPTVFVFEDVHWAEAAEYDLIRYLAQYVRDVPAMFLALARPDLLEQHADWSSGLLTYSAMQLEPLSDRDARAIVEAVAGDKLPTEDIARLVNTGAGNPLFLEELATALVEGAGSMDQLPTNVRAAIASRVDALPAEARAVLLTASVVGRAFWAGAVAAATEGADVRAALEVLETRDLVRRQPTTDVPGDVEFRFKHALIRDVCYATLPRADRARAHAAVADYFEQLVTDNGDLAGLLAHHYEQAGDARRATSYLLAAAERAQMALAVSDMKALLDRAERLAPDEPARVHVRLARAAALTRLEEYDDGYDALQALIPALDDGDLLDALLDFACCCHWTERTEEVLDASQRAFALARRLGREDRVAPALARMSQGLAMRGAEGDLGRAIELGEQALSTWAPDVRSGDLADHEHLLADQYYWVGRYDRALTLARASRETAVDDPTSAEARLRGAGMEGLVLAGMGRYREALAMSDDVLALAEDMGRPRRVLTNYSTLVYRELFDLDEARQRSEWVLDGFPPSSFHMPWMNAATDLVHVDVLAHEWGAALSRWEVLYPQVVQTPAWERWLLGCKLATFRAEVALYADDAQTAADWAERALASTRSAGRVKYEIAARDVLGRALSRLGRGDEGSRQVAAAASAADALGNPHTQLLVHAHLAELLYAVGDDDGAARHHRVAEQVVDDVASALSPDRARLYRESVPLTRPSDYR